MCDVIIQEMWTCWKAVVRSPQDQAVALMGFEQFQFVSIPGFGHS